MLGYINQLSYLSEQFKSPIICAGDIFHKWNSPPELINWAIDNLPHMFAIPGQHDLPLHNYEDIKKSAYWTLVEAGSITNLFPTRPKPISSNITLHGYPWGFEISPWKERKKKVKEENQINLAVIHAYCWLEGHSFPGCPEEQHVRQWRKKLIGYDSAVFGDNHNGFGAKFLKPECDILNNGSLINSKSDQKDYKPSVGLLLKNGSIERHFLDTSEDRWEEDVLKDLKDNKSMDIEDLVEILEKVGEQTLDFKDIIKHYLSSKKVPDSVRNIILKSLE